MMRRCAMLWIRRSLAPSFLGPLLLAPLALILLAALFVAPAGAQVGQQPDRNRRPPVTAGSPGSNTSSPNANGAGQAADANSLQPSYPGVNATLERAFIA